MIETREQLHARQFRFNLKFNLERVAIALQTHNLKAVRKVYSSLPSLLFNRLYNFSFNLNSNIMHSISNGYSALINQEYNKANLYANVLDTELRKVVYNNDIH